MDAFDWKECRDSLNLVRVVSAPNGPDAWPDIALTARTVATPRKGFMHIGRYAARRDRDTDKTDDTLFRNQ